MKNHENHDSPTLSCLLFSFDGAKSVIWGRICGPKVKGQVGDEIGVAPAKVICSSEQFLA
jgi:hypothetical protein